MSENDFKRADIHSEIILGVPAIHTMIIFGNTAMLCPPNTKYTDKNDVIITKTSLEEWLLRQEIQLDITWPHDMSISQTTSTTTNRPYAQLQKLVKLEQFKVGKAGFSL